MFFSVTGGKFDVHGKKEDAVRTGGAVLDSSGLSITRRNLLTVRDYESYCGADFCSKGMPRAHFDGMQFICECGWRSSLEQEFLLFYRSFRRSWLESPEIPRTEPEPLETTEMVVAEPEKIPEIAREEPILREWIENPTPLRVFLYQRSRKSPWTMLFGCSEFEKAARKVVEYLGGKAVGWDVPIPPEILDKRELNHFHPGFSHTFCPKYMKNQILTDLFIQEVSKPEKLNSTEIDQCTKSPPQELKTNEEDLKVQVPE